MKQGYFTQVPDLICVRVPVWLCDFVAAKADTLRDIATRAAVAAKTILRVFMGTSSFAVCLEDISIERAKQKSVFN
ncbi:hypothetical protein KI809_19320 [Geobacter pelophilus]|uniref:Uncharacterized protein n=1 Tax=Geoanaerobacter pelophilus TaxID=60036 RepID=A0AAW4L6N7_9BACT|nr:hypothetical protein [Geoanaerobacter pelophilus]MBT0666464.1 hypothetical protein [Geoanaerobacter pelophilus]